MDDFLYRPEHYSHTASHTRYALQTSTSSPPGWAADTSGSGFFGFGPLPHGSGIQVQPQYDRPHGSVPQHRAFTPPQFPTPDTTSQPAPQDAVSRVPAQDVDPSPPSQAVTVPPLSPATTIQPLDVRFPPPEWREIPQTLYKWEQYDFVRSDPIIFKVDGFPGVNLRSAYDGAPTGLEGRDNFVLEGRGVITCIFLFLGYPRKTYQASSPVSVVCPVLIADLDPHKKLRWEFYQTRRARERNLEETKELLGTGGWVAGHGPVYRWSVEDRQGIHET